ncbi:hypothetical protein DL95DRAFT_401046 [Leptodontidium sp. 2 PMI_412]|nr:hypothetical protein DL95DRAFT_401046 [Leptodontidium sp. 2 PMI_412]
MKAEFQARRKFSSIAVTESGSLFSVDAKYNLAGHHSQQETTFQDVICIAARDPAVSQNSHLVHFTRDSRKHHHLDWLSNWEEVASELTPPTTASSTMKKWMTTKSTKTVVVSPPTPTEGGAIKFMYEKAGSLVVASSSKTDGKYAGVEIVISKEKSNLKTGGEEVKGEVLRKNGPGMIDINKKGVKSKLDLIEEVDNSRSVDIAARDTAHDQHQDRDQSQPLPEENSKPINRFEGDEEKMDIFHDEIRRDQVALRYDKLEIMMGELEKELDVLGDEIGELIKRERVEVENLEGSLREVERRRAGKRGDRGRGR